MLARNSGRLELALDMKRVRDAGREHHAPAALGMAVPMRDDIADQFVLVHPRRQLALDIIALSGFNPSQVRLIRRKDSRSDKIATLDQRRDLRPFDDGIENAA